LGIVKDKRTKKYRKKAKTQKKLISANASRSLMNQTSNSLIDMSRIIDVLYNDIASVGSFIPFVSKWDWYPNKLIAGAKRQTRLNNLIVL